MSATGASSRAIRRVFALSAGPWPTQDPFLFCVHHKDDYPKGYKGTMGPDPITHRGRDMGSDFSYKDGYSFYHGDIVPGFPQHPHRGFETVTFTLKGLIDHSDSMGATARYGNGDVQWMTAGAGIQHAEMFPLLDDENPNPAELFQIWLNLPARSKMVPPAFKMFWEPEVPKFSLPARDDKGQPIAGSIGAEVQVVSGYPVKLSATELATVTKAPNPPPDSWASDPNSDVAIWTLKIKNGQSVALPPCASAQSNRTVYFYRAPDAGSQPELLIADGASEAINFEGAAKIRNRQGAEIQRTDFWTGLRAVGGDVEVLVLQGRAIGEPVAQHGPFVMNTREEIMQAFSDYRKTQFGGWPWDTPDPVHSIKQGRFALHADGRREDAPAPAK